MQVHSLFNVPLPQRLVGGDEACVEDMELPIDLSVHSCLGSLPTNFELPKAPLVEAVIQVGGPLSGSAEVGRQQDTIRSVGRLLLLLIRNYESKRGKKPSDLAQLIATLTSHSLLSSLPTQRTIGVLGPGLFLRGSVEELCSSRSCKGALHGGIRKDGLMEGAKDALPHALEGQRCHSPRRSRPGQSLCLVEDHVAVNPAFPDWKEDFHLSKADGNLGLEGNQC